MLTQVEVTSSRSDVPVLLLGEFYPNQNPVQIRDISGLDPVKAEIVTTPFAQDGVLFQNSRLGMRNIVLKLGLNPVEADQTMSSLRHMLYKYFLPKTWCKFRFYSNDMPTVEIEGYVEDFEPNMFSQDPEIQISVICPQPDFVGIDRNELSGFDIPSNIMSFDYYGTAETGFEINIDMIAFTTVDSIWVRAWRSGASLVERFDTKLVNASSAYYFHLSTIKNSKKSEYIRRSDGLIINQMVNMINGSAFPLIRPGVNNVDVLRYNSTSPPQNPKAWTLWFYNRYGGL